MIIRRTYFTVICLLTVSGLCQAQTPDDDTYQKHVTSTARVLLEAESDEGGTAVSNSVTLRSGMMSYSQSGYGERTDDTESEISLEKGANFSNGALEFEWFYRTNCSTFLGYRLARNNAINRTQYQAGYGGWRYYANTPGLPVISRRGTSRIHFDSKLNPYFDIGLSSGRYLARTFGKEAALDVSSEFYGIQFGTGVKTNITQRFAADFSVTVESVKGYGPLKFYAVSNYIYAGIHYYY